MKRSGFRKPTIEEVREKQAKKRDGFDIIQERSRKLGELWQGKIKKDLSELGSALRSHKMPVAKSKPKKAVKTQAWLKKELDRVFSIYIRQKYADPHTGVVKCYTCSTYKHWKEIQNGHWIPRNVMGTRFSEENCRPQCVACNMFQKGMPDVFAVNLLNEGVDIQELQKQRYSTVKVDRHWYEEKIQHYKALI